MESLVRMGMDGRLEGAVAEDWEVTPTTATFWLRKNAKWSDGKAVTAADFIFSWQTALKPETGSEYAFLLFAVKNAEAINNGTLRKRARRISSEPQHFGHRANGRSFFRQDASLPDISAHPQDFFLATKGRFGADADQLLYNGPFQITLGAQFQYDL